MSSAVVEEPPAKKPKVDNVEKDIDDGGPLLSFHEFSMDRVLFTDPSTKAMAVCGRFSGSEDKAVIVAEKQPLEHSTIRQLFEKRDGGVVRNTHNDIYSQYVVQCRGDVGTLKLTTVYPATDKHVRKYSRQMFHLVHETPQIYKDVTKPFIEQQGFSIKWVDNILNGISESDRVVYDDPDPETGFLLLPDLKWDMKNMDTLYMLALARKREILSLRELTSEHLPLLKNILEKGKAAIYDKYGVCKDELRAYLHYQPSYYHLHVHFTHLSYAAPKTTVGDAHLLDDVIDNIENIDPLYYSKKTLTFSLNESSALWQEFKSLQSTKP